MSRLAHAPRERHDLNGTLLLGSLSSEKVKEKREEIMYLYGERNLKEKLKILIFDI